MTEITLMGGPRDGQTLSLSDRIVQIACPGWTVPAGDLCSWNYDAKTGALLGFSGVTPQPRDHPNLGDMIVEELDDYEVGWRDGYDAALRGDAR